VFSSPDIIRVVKSRRVKRTGHVARMEERINMYKIVVGKPEGKRQLGRHCRRWEDNIEMTLGEIG
jgi:hypothetical protein